MNALKNRTVAVGAVLLMCLTMFAGVYAVSEESDAAAPVDRTVTFGSEDYPLNYFYGSPTLKTTYHVYISAGSDIYLLQGSQGDLTRVTGTTDVAVESYTMDNGKTSKKLEGTVSTLGTFTVVCSRASMQSYDPGNFIFHVVQPNNYPVIAGESFSWTIITMDPAYPNNGFSYFGGEESPDWVTESYDYSAYTLTGTAPDEPGVYTANYYSNSDFTYKRVSVNIEVKASVKTHTVTYDGNGSTSGSVADTVVTDTNNGNTDVTLAANGFAKSGYSFTGWLVGSNVYQPGQSVPVGPNGSVTAVAQWSQNTLNVSAGDISAVSNLSYGNQISASASNGATLSYAVKSCTGGTASVNTGGTVTYKAPTVNATVSYTVTVTVTATFADSSTISKDVSFSVTVDPVLSFTNAATSGTLSVKGA